VSWAWVFFYCSIAFDVGMLVGYFIIGARSEKRFNAFMKNAEYRLTEERQAIIRILRTTRPEVTFEEFQ
jgi:hypothetical protein